MSSPALAPSPSTVGAVGGRGHGRWSRPRGPPGSPAPGRTGKAVRLCPLHPLRTTLGWIRAEGAMARTAAARTGAAGVAGPERGVLEAAGAGVFAAGEL